MHYIKCNFRIREINSLVYKLFCNNNVQIRAYTANNKSNEFIARHIGPRDNDKKVMLETLGFKVYLM